MGAPSRVLASFELNACADSHSHSCVFILNMVGDELGERDGGLLSSAPYVQCCSFHSLHSVSEMSRVLCARLVLLCCWALLAKIRLMSPTTVLATEMRF